MVLFVYLAVLALSSYVGRQIDSAIGTEATDISQCKTQAIGKKACGGPGGYIVYSTHTTDIDRYLNLIATRDTLLKIKYLPVWILRKIVGEGASDCMLVMSPALKLIDGKCVASTNGIND